MQKSIHSHEAQTLARLLRELRLSQGLRQEDVAAKLDRPARFVSRYEVGEKMLDVPELRQVCAALGANLVDFITQYEEILREQPSD